VEIQNFIITFFTRTTGSCSDPHYSSLYPVSSRSILILPATRTLKYSNFLSISLPKLYMYFSSLRLSSPSFRHPHILRWIRVTDLKTIISFSLFVLPLFFSTKCFSRQLVFERPYRISVLPFMWQTKCRTQKQQVNFVLNGCVVWPGNLMENRRLKVFLRAEWWRRLSELKVVKVTVLRK